MIDQNILAVVNHEEVAIYLSPDKAAGSVEQARSFVYADLLLALCLLCLYAESRLDVWVVLVPRPNTIAISYY